MKNQGLIVLLILSTVISGCYKDQDRSQAPVTVIEVPDTKINTTVYGVVIDHDGTPIDVFEAKTKENFISVEYEIFKLKLIQANKKNQHFSFTKDNQEIAFANVSLIENDYNKLEVKRFPQWTTSSNLAESSVIAENENLEIKLNEQQTQEVTSGLIEDKSTLQQMGIWGRGIDEENYFLSPITAFYYQNNQSDNTLSITYLGPNSTGEKIGLFHLNDSFKQWVLLDQFDSANLNIESDTQGYYMLANYTASTFLEGEISYNQLPVSFQQIEIETALDHNISLVTSANGRWSTHVPEESTLSLLIQNPCGDLISPKETIGNNPIVTHQSVLSQMSNDAFLPLNFKTVDCEGNAQDRSGLQVDFGQKVASFVFGSNHIETVLSTCGDVNITGIDIYSNMRGTTIDWNEEIQDELGVLSICNTTEKGYSYLKINNEEETLPPFDLIEENGNIILSAQDNSFRLRIKGNEIGTYMENQVNIFIDDPDFGRDGYYIKCENSPVGCGIDDCYISHLEEMENGLTRISFSGVLWMQTINNPTAGNYPIEGQIIIKQ